MWQAAIHIRDDLLIPLAQKLGEERGQRIWTTCIEKEPEVRLWLCFQEIQASSKHPQLAATARGCPPGDAHRQSRVSPQKWQATCRSANSELRLATGKGTAAPLHAAGGGPRRHAPGTSISKKNNESIILPYFTTGRFPPLVWGQQTFEINKVVLKSHW